MDAGTLLGRRAEDGGCRTEREGDPESEDSALERRAVDAQPVGRRSLCFVVTLLAGGIAAVAAVADGSLSVTGGQVGPLVGVLGMGVVGMAVSSDDDDGIAALTEKVERAREGEPVSFETDRDDGLGELAAAVDGLVDELDDCRREREVREHEQRLEEYREYTEDILDAIDDVFYVFDERGRIQRWNDSLPEVTGYTDAEIESMHGTEFFSADDHEQVAEATATVFETGKDRRVDA
ncbi:hypothetical protein BRD06_00845, partial [Halobacteriales archaeon QS_9_67_15]